MKGTQQEAGIDVDFNPHLTGDHQIEDFGGGRGTRLGEAQRLYFN